MREGYTPQIPEDEGYLENLRDRVMTRMRQLGLPADLSEYEADDENPFQDLRE